MTEEEKKALLKKDMITAMEFNRVLDLRDKTQLNHLKMLLERKSYFKTSFSVIYLNRINDILEDNDPDTCIKCKRQGTYDGFWCEECITKLTGRVFETEVIEVKAPKKKKATNELASFELPRFKLPRFKVPDLKPVGLAFSAVGLLAIMIVLGRGMQSQYLVQQNADNTERDIIQSAELENGEPADDTVGGQMSVSYQQVEGDFLITTEDEAKALLEKMFVSNDTETFQVEYFGESQVVGRSFLVEVGENVKEADELEGDEEKLDVLVDCWQFNVTANSNEKTGSCYFIVNQDGKVLKEGEFGKKTYFEQFRIR